MTRKKNFFDPKKKFFCPEKKLLIQKFLRKNLKKLYVAHYHWVTTILPIFHKWSIEKDPAQVNNKAWSFEPNVKLKDYTSAYQWYSKRKQIFFQNEYYFVSAGQKKHLKSEK